ncbi:MAG: TetR/AcrR family transcriptional regulator [Pseudomonadota bacterium]
MAQSQRINDQTAAEQLVGNTKVTRQDWLNAALDTLIHDGVENVKVLTLARRLDVSRSSFYWYFKDRKDILDALLEYWHSTNTAALIRHAEMPAQTITEACCNVFRCFVTPGTFDNALDFTIRDWARRSAEVRHSLDNSVARRLNALQAMFERFDYEPVEALVRARTLYYMQIGYNDADLREPMDVRMSLHPHYVYAFTGRMPSDVEIATFRAHVHQALEEQNP